MNSFFFRIRECKVRKMVYKRGIRRRILGSFAAAALIATVCLPARGFAAQTSKDVVESGAETILDAAESTADKLEEEMRDPEKGDFVLSSSGKILERSQGKWVLPKESADPEGRFTIVFTGDIIFDRGQNPWVASAYSDGIGTCFDEDSLKIMREADFLVVNNEFAYTDGGSPIPNKKFTFRCPPETAEWLDEIGTDIAALANNHIYDYGEEGILDTFDTLDEVGIPYIGAGRDLSEAHKPAYLIADGTITAILNATEIERYENPETRGAEEDSPGVFRCLDDEDLCEQVREAKEHADLVIVFVHWGTELMPAAEESQISKAEDLAEAGADLIVGAHPHVLQNIEYVNGVPVFYSLGNYFFSASTRDSGVLRVTVDTKERALSSLQFIPMQQRQGVKTLYDGEKERVLDTMRSLSPGVNIDEEGYFEEE
ncbi:MAG TPA: capsule biosynthesis protein [Lachnospiraceae bacterium]|nr:capsule biosynthesis protein [Lachnospiraceae bacterium]